MPSSLLPLLCLLSASNLCDCLDSSSKVNRKQDDVISGSGSSKQNGIVSLLRAAGSVRRNGVGSKVNSEEGRGLERRRRMDESMSDGIGPLSTEGSQVVVVLNDVVENLASLRDLVNSLKYQSHVMYRQLKKMRMKFCSQERMLDEHPPSPPLHQQQSLQQDGRYNPKDLQYPSAPGPVSAALRVEVSGPEAGKGRGPVAAVGDEGPCPGQFSYSAETGRCYRLSGDRTTWRTARESCRWMKGSLASVDSAREQRVINDMARASTATQHCDFWIGLTRQGPMPSMDWYWDGDGHLPSFTNWNDREPNNGNGDEHCAQMLWVFNWRWNDAPCSHGNACFVCETRPKVTTSQ